MPYKRQPPLKQHFGHLICHMLDSRKIHAHYIFCVGLRLVQYLEYVSFSDFELFMLCWSRKLRLTTVGDVPR
jgi:hypothetical protein